METIDRIIPLFIEQNFLKEQKRITSSQEWVSFYNAQRILYNTALRKGLPFNPKTNAIHWAFDVVRLCKEITFSCCWMNAYAKFYKKRVSPGSQPAHVDFHVSYFADNCITRIDSCRDKLALMVWAFYCPFNPEKREEILDYQRIVDRLRFPIKFGLKLKNQKNFLEYLEILHGADFDRVEKYRHLKIHRREPRIEIYGVEPHHDWDYMFPLVDDKEITDWEKELEKQYPDPQFRKHIKKGCYIGEVLFERRKIKDRLWDFEEVQRHVESCLIKLLRASDGCFGMVGRRFPLKRIKSVIRKKVGPVK
jgi:hypothetical protein